MMMMVLIVKKYLVILSHIGDKRDENNCFYFGWLDLLALRLQSFLIIVNTALLLIYAIYSLPLHTH
jgi:hypothetical protein